MDFLRRAALALAALLAFAATAAAQSQPAPTGSIEFSANVTPTDGRPQPVRQFTFYLLRKSIADIHADVQAADPPPQLDAFIDALAVSPELKTWMKKHQSVELAGSDFTHGLTPDDVLNVPEFMNAYITYNNTYPGSDFPVAKYKSIDQAKYPDKYALGQKQYRDAILHYVTANPQSKDGMEAYLTDFDATRKWTALVMGELDRVHKRTLNLAQTQYLVAQSDSDLDGLGAFRAVPPGDYWLGTLGSIAQAGDVRETWDLEVEVRAGQTTNVALTNVNAVPSIFPAR